MSGKRKGVQKIAQAIKNIFTKNKNKVELTPEEFRKKTEAFRNSIEGQDNLIKTGRLKVHTNYGGKKNKIVNLKEVQKSSMMGGAVGPNGVL